MLTGFINTHVHTSQQLARGIADDVDLMTWLHERIWPYEANMTEEDSFISTLLCGIELIHSGVSVTHSKFSSGFGIPLENGIANSADMFIFLPTDYYYYVFG